MLSKCKVILFSIIIMFIIISCNETLYIPTISDSQSSGVSTDTLVLGRKLYVYSCGNCHNLYRPEQFTTEEWGKVLIKMQTKAKSNNQGTKQILKYLNARAKKY